MRAWTSVPVDDIRLGNVIEYRGVMGELVSKRPSSRADSVTLLTKEHGPVTVYIDTLVDVYR